MFQGGIWSALNLWALVAMLFSEEHVLEQMVDDTKKLDDMVMSQAVVKIVMKSCVVWKTRNIELLAEHLQASRVGISTVTLNAIHCNDFNSCDVENVQSSCSIISFHESVFYSLSW